jgi:methyl-accepting chemotaxis protein/CHASE3 domain sensor protein
MGWSVKIARLSVRQRIFGGFALLICVFLAAVGISLRGVAVVDRQSAEVATSSALAEKITDFVAQADAAQISVFRYALSENDADLRSGQEALTRFAETTRSMEALVAERGGKLKGAAAEIFAAQRQYQTAVDGTIRAITARREGTIEFIKQTTELRTIISAIPGALLRETTEPETMATAIRLAEAFQAGNGAAARFLASRNPSDASAAQHEFEAVRTAMDSLKGSTGGNRRVQRFLTALDEPMGRAEMAFKELVVSNEAFTRSSEERDAAGSSLQEGLAKVRGASAAQQHAALGSMRISAGNSWRRGLIAAALSLALGVLLAWRIGRSIILSLGRITASMRKLADGDLSADVPHRGEQTEIGTMADAVQIFKDALIAKKNADESAAIAIEARMQRVQRRDGLTRNFEKNISALTKSLSDAAAQMQRTAQEMTSIAEQATSQSASVSEAAGRTSTNVHQVAAATEELSASIQEISSQVFRSAKITERIVTDTEHTNATVKKLAATAERIGDVVALISNIANQTNLLALNATIEAARAGEAGKGFAVVATEVKALAGQTTKATDQISAQISEIQEATAQAVNAIQEIAARITEMSGTSAGVAAAVEQQGAATQEIARNVHEAANGTEQVTSNIGELRQSAGETGAAASKVLSAAQELARHSSSLEHEVQNFLSSVNAA